MEVKYSIDGRDSWSLTKYLFFHEPTFWAPWLFFTALIPVLVALVAYEWSPDPVTRIEVAVGATVLWVAFRILQTRSRVYKRAARDAAELHVSLTISEDGILFQRKSANGWLHWRYFTQVAQTSRHIFLFFTRVQAMIIPKRFFSSPEQASAFFTAAQQFHANPKADLIDPRSQSTVPPDALIVGYQIVPDDYVRFFREHMTGSGAKQTAAAIFIGIAMTIVAVLTLSTSFSGGRLNLGLGAFGLIFLALPAAMVWTRTPWYYLYSARKTIKSNFEPHARQTVLLLPEALVMKTEFSDTRYSWGDLSAVDDTPSNICISQRGITALVIPKRAFASPYEAQAFFHAARGYLQQAKSGALVDQPKEGSWPPAPSIKA